MFAKLKKKLEDEVGSELGSGVLLTSAGGVSDRRVGGSSTQVRGQIISQIIKKKMK
jgi:hypothetical protein